MTGELLLLVYLYIYLNICVFVNCEWVWAWGGAADCSVQWTLGRRHWHLPGLTFHFQFRVFLYLCIFVYLHSCIYLCIRICIFVQRTLNSWAPLALGRPHFSSFFCFPTFAVFSCFYSGDDQFMENKRIVFTPMFAMFEISSLSFATTFVEIFYLFLVKNGKLKLQQQLIWAGNEL